MMRRGAADAKTVRRGFTLTEILAVVAVVAVLAVSLFPTIRGMINRGTGAGCLSNLRQIGAACQAYAADNGGYLPRPGWSSSGTSVASWQPLLDPYLSPNVTDWNNARQASKYSTIIKSVFLCPAEKSPGKDNGFYGMNKEFRVDLYGENSRISMASIAQPSRYMLVSDTYKSLWVLTDRRDKMVNSSGLTRRHEGRPNFLYADGHAAPFAEPLLGYNESKDEFYQTLWWHLGRQPD